MQNYQTYHYIFQNLTGECEVNKIMGQKTLKYVIIEVKDNGITKVNNINCIIVTSGNVAYLPRDVFSNCFAESFPFLYRYRAIMITFWDYLIQYYPMEGTT